MDSFQAQKTPRELDTLDFARLFDRMEAELIDTFSSHSSVIRGFQTFLGMDKCVVCSLPYKTRKEVEGMLKGGWTPEDLEHWIALRFRLKVSPESLRTHQEQCQKTPSPGKELVEVEELDQGLVLYVQTP